MASITFLNALVGRRAFIELFARIVAGIASSATDGRDEEPDDEPIDVYAGPDIDDWYDDEDAGDDVFDDVPTAIYAGPPIEEYEDGEEEDGGPDDVPVTIYAGPPIERRSVKELAGFSLDSKALRSDRPAYPRNYL